MSQARSIPIEFPPDPLSKHALREMIERIDDVLYSVEEQGTLVHDPDKPWNCEMLEEIARIVQEYRQSVSDTPVSTPPTSQTLRDLSCFLNGETFIVLICDHCSDDPDPFAAWAYSGPLDFDEASSETFGIGPDLPSALNALAIQLKQ